MRLLYDLFFLVFSLFYAPYLLIKGKAHGGLVERFSFLPEDVVRQEKPVWIHAVSVGEAVLAASLAKSIKEKFPGTPVVVSTTTRTGNEMIRKSADGAVDAVFYFPLDMSFIVSRVVRLIDPVMYIMIETELWPNLLEEFRLRGIPVILANGRISDSSFSNYKRIGFIVRRILGCISSFCMQSEKSAERIEKLGAPADRVHITGNMKFEVSQAFSELKGFDKEKLGFTESDDVIVAGSTHPPEEEMMLSVYEALKKQKKDLKLVLVPRHVERSDAIKSSIEKTGLSSRKFSDILSDEEVAPGHDVVLVDTIGHLKDIYSAATLIFIGGSFAQRGGQNPIEGACWGKVVVFGPDMDNFREIAEIFVESNAALGVKDAVGLEGALLELLNDPDKRHQMGKNAVRVIEENAGAVSRTVERIKEYL